jgi:biotin transport system permease protein
MLTLTSPVETRFHGLPAGAKMAALCVVTAGLVFVASPGVLAVVVLAALALMAAGGRVFLLHGLRLLRPLWPFVLIVAGWHLWTGELRDGAAILLRLIAVVMLANLVTMTTRLSDMIGVIERLAAPLGRFGLSPRVLALAIALVIRFVPVLADRVGQIRDAIRARSPRRPGWRLMVPATLAALDDADHAAEALRARGGLS